jgi:type I restriction enzyme, S subunit
MRAGWREQPLGELCTVLDSKRVPITRRDRVPGNVPYYGATGILDRVAGHIFDEPLVLIGEDGAKWECGEPTAFAISGRSWVNNHAHAVRPHRDKLLDAWLVYHLRFLDLTPFVTGLTVPKLNQEMLRSIPIPLAPLAEQQRIVAILDEAFKGIGVVMANAERTLAKAHDLFRAILSAALTAGRDRWAYARVEEFTEVCLGKMLDKAKNRGTPRPYLRNLNVRWLEFDLSDVLEMPFEDGEVERYTARSGDLMVCEGGYPGRAAVWTGEPIFFQKAIHRVRCHEPQRAPWLLYFLLMSDLNGSLKAHFTGAGIQHFTAQAFKRMKVPLPPLPEQQHLVTMLDEVFGEIAGAKAIQTRKLAALAELKQSLLARAFSSELTAADAKAA